ncbi:MAG: hypothetical protein AAGI88_20020, partial [Pseudomonadota bacterium]
VDIDHLHGRDRHADLVFSLNSLGLARAANGDSAGADEAFTEALSLADGTSHRLSGVIRVHRAVVACDDGKVSLADTYLQEARELLERDYASDDWRLHYFRGVHAECVQADGDQEAAAETARASRQAIEAIKGPENLFTRLAREREDRILAL